MDSKEFIKYIEKYFPEANIVTVDLNTKNNKNKTKLTTFERNLNNMIYTIESIDILKVVETDSHYIINTIGCMIACINSYDINKIHNKKLLIKYNNFLIKYRRIFDTIFYRKIKDAKIRLYRENNTKTKRKDDTDANLR